MSNLSLGGLATGMDTASIIDQLVALERRPIYNYQNEISELEQTKGAWRDINTRLDNLESKISDLKLSSTYTSRTTSTSDSEIATATASNSAIEGSYDIVVKQTAKAQRILGTKMSDDSVALNTLTGLGSLPAESEIMVNGEVILVSNTDTLNDLVTKINNSDTGVKASNVDNHLVLESKETGIDNEIGLIDANSLLENLGVITAGDNDKTIQSNNLKVTNANTALGFSGSFQIDLMESDGTVSSTGEITVGETATLNDIKSQIDGIANMSATVVDEGNGYFSLQVNSSVIDSSVIISNTGSDNKLLKDLSFGNRAYANQYQVASDAIIEVNGITDITSSTNSFSDVVEGVTFNINSNTAIDSTATISVSKDKDKTVSTVQSFVDQYNSLMSFIDKKTSYDSDTKTASILQGDGTIMRLEMRLRELVTNKVNSNSDYTTLSSVGISIDRHGVMSLDSNVLKEALDVAPDDVKNLFKAESDVEGYDGMATRIDSYVDQLLQLNTGLIPRRLDFYDDRIEGLNEDIEDVERRVEMVRKRYTAQFTAMEKAISKMQQQQNWMMSQLQSLSGGNTSSSLS